ncbi:MAG: GDYXXLXY domain-containing protein [Alphaproteobacteria bacterium]|nr:GDYXXLXY domain-containing protein [Alphaproteobacteria bacterium]
MATTLRILIVVALQTALLAYMILDRQAVLSAARTVTLKVVPVDPRDIFRGDYVILTYEISRLDPTKIEGDNTFGYGDKVLVTLVPNGDTWTATGIARGKPVPAQGGVAIQGTIESFDANETGQATAVTVHYGIESYFVPEGTGREIEQERQKGDLSADIAVDASGRAAIKALRRGGQVFYVEGIF